MLLDPLRGVFILLLPIDVRQGWPHQDRQFTQRRAFHANLGQSFSKLNDELRMPLCHVRGLAGVVLQVVERVADQLEGTFANGRQTHTAGNFDHDLVTGTWLIAEDHVGHIDPVQRPVLFERASRQGDQRVEYVDHMHHAVIRGAGLHFPRPTNNTRYSDAPFKGCVFGAPVRSIEGLLQPTVVIREQEQRIVVKSVLVDGGSDPSDRVVQTFQCRIPLVVLVEIPRNLFQRAVDGVERDIQKEGPIVGLLREQPYGAVK